MNLKDNKDAFNNPHSARSISKAINHYIEFFTRKKILTQDLQAEDIIDGHFLPKKI